MTTDYRDQIRRDLSASFAGRMSELHKTKDAFLQSQSFGGFDRAFDSWHAALWKWVETPVKDGAILPSTLQRLSETQHDWQSFCPSASEAERAHDEELGRQTFLFQRAGFLTGMERAAGENAEWYAGWGRRMSSYVAGQIDDDQVHDALAERKQRKPSKDVGNRNLKFSMLYCWISAALWTLTTEGVAAFLQRTFPRSDDGVYDPKTISDLRRDLGLFRLSNPRFGGLGGEPLRLISR